jgi:cytochrome c553
MGVGPATIGPASALEQTTANRGASPPDRSSSPAARGGDRTHGDEYVPPMYSLMKRFRVSVGAVLTALSMVGVGAGGQARPAKPPFEVPSWAFPLPAPAPPLQVDSVTLHHVPHASAAFTEAQVRDQFAVIDWHPQTHQAPPSIVAHGRKPAVIACGYCHLPDGEGRPENAMLAGLPAAYIEQQLADIKSRARRAAWPGPYRPSDLMRTIADSLTPTEVAEAARYFSRLQPRRRTRVIEAATIPRVTPGLGLYVTALGHETEPLGMRLIELALDPARHELRDADAPYAAYVPPGSIGRGRALATVGMNGSKPCMSCHGAMLDGVGLIPPLAGRSPSYLLRQLFAFKAGTRATLADAPMRDVAATLDLKDMISAAAYIGSLTPPAKR